MQVNGTQLGFLSLHNLHIPHWLALKATETNSKAILGWFDSRVKSLELQKRQNNALMCLGKLSSKFKSVYCIF